MIDDETTGREIVEIVLALFGVPCAIVLMIGGTVRLMQWMF